MAEEWRPIPGFGGMYEISNFAEVRSWRISGGIHDPTVRAEKPRILSPFLRRRKGKMDELQIPLWDGKQKTRPIAVKNLMRDVWMDGPIPGMFVNLIDRDPTNCSLHNLKYESLAEGRKNRHLAHRKPVAKYNAHHEVVCFYSSAVEAAKKNYLTPAGVRNRIRRGTVIDGVYFKFAT